MSEILGYDIDGKPLRAGDKVVQASPGGGGARPRPGPWTISGPDPEGDSRFVALLEPDMDGDAWCAVAKYLRRIDDRSDHQPSGESFETLMSRLKSGDIVSRPEGVAT